jgi:hypothetical protein
VEKSPFRRQTNTILKKPGMAPIGMPYISS